MYILITADKIKIPISQREKHAIMEAVRDKKKSIVLQENLISLQIIPTIIEFTTWYAQENEKLKAFNKRLCKECLCVMDMTAGCNCWKRNKGEDLNAFKSPVLPEKVKKALKPKSFPKLLDVDKGEIEFLENKKNKTNYVEGNYLGYTDPETGETLYQ